MRSGPGMLRQPGASATRVLSQSGAESREEGKGPPQVSDLFRGPGWPGIPFTPEVMVGHFAALPCPRRWRTFRPHRLVVFLPPGTAVGCSLRALGSCPVQRCSQRPERNFKPLEQYGREPVCRRSAKGTRPWPTFPPLALFWNVLRGGSSSLGAWIGEGAWRGRVWAARERERPTGLSRGWGAGETEWKQVPAAPGASEQLPVGAEARSPVTFLLPEPWGRCCFSQC